MRPPINNDYILKNAKKDEIDYVCSLFPNCKIIDEAQSCMKLVNPTNGYGDKIVTIIDLSYNGKIKISDRHENSDDLRMTILYDNYEERKGLIVHVIFNLSGDLLCESRIDEFMEYGHNFCYFYEIELPNNDSFDNIEFYIDKMRKIIGKEDSQNVQYVIQIPMCSEFFEWSIRFINEVDRNFPGIIRGFSEINENDLDSRFSSIGVFKAV